MSEQITKEGWVLKKLGEVLSYEQPTKYLVRSAAYQSHFSTPVLTAGKTFLLGNTDESFGVYDNLPVIIFDDFTTASKFVDFPFKAKSSAMKMLKSRSEYYNPKLLFEILNSLKFEVSDHKRHWISEFANIEISIPGSQVEQEAIAQVLSDFDNLIDGLERLIVKKRSIKEGVMQELLRPKEGWVVRKLDDIARLYNGYAFKSADYVEVGDYKIITIANVQEGQMTYTGTSRLDKLPVDIQAHQKLELGDILVSMTGNVGRVCQVNIENALLNQRVGKIVGYGLSPSFLFSVLNTKNFQNKMIELAQGGAQGNIGKWDILNFEVCAPSDLSEQNKIAQTIGDLDEELSLLEGKLFKYNQIKQGVMNELITGKTRLV